MKTEMKTELKTINQTKIVATLGPASSKIEIIEELIMAGANVFRLNFSHGTHEQHKQNTELVRRAATQCNKNIAILADLQGPKIRIAQFIQTDEDKAKEKEPSANLVNGEQFIIDSALAKDAGTQYSVGVDYPEIINECKIGDTLLLDDGLITLQVKETNSQQLICEVIEGGELKNNKGINLKGGGLSAPALTDKDKADIEVIAKLDIDFVAISFVREAGEIEQARSLLQSYDCDAHLVAKIERAEAVADYDKLDEIIRASDCVMVARGDLGVEVGDEELMGLQKHLIRRSRELNKLVITATQMMESMSENPVPTRAEVMDVANAVIDGTDAVMLSGETASGKYPVETVAKVSKVIAGAEKTKGWVLPEDLHSVSNIDESIASAATSTANLMNQLRAILCLTTSGNTPLLLSRRYIQHPIYAFSSRLKAQRRMALYRNVQPLAIKLSSPQDPSLVAAIAALKQKQLVDSGDNIIVTYGDISGAVGGSNTMKIITIE